MDIQSILEQWQAFTKSTFIGAVKDDEHCEYLMDMYELLLEHSFTLDEEAAKPVTALVSAIESILADYDEELLAEDKKPFLRLVKTTREDD